MHLATEPVGLSPEVLTILPALLLWIVGFVFLDKANKLRYAFVCLLATIGGFVWIFNYFGASQSFQFIAGVFWAVFVSIGRLSSKSASSKPFYAAVVAIGAVVLFIVIPGTFNQPSGTVWDALVAGWNTLAEALNIFVDWLQGYRG